MNPPHTTTVQLQGRGKVDIAVNEKTGDILYTTPDGEMATIYIETVLAQITDNAAKNQEKSTQKADENQENSAELAEALRVQIEKWSKGKRSRIKEKFERKLAKIGKMPKEKQYEALKEFYIEVQKRQRAANKQGESAKANSPEDETSLTDLDYLKKYPALVRRLKSRRLYSPEIKSSTGFVVASVADIEESCPNELLRRLKNKYSYGVVVNVAEAIMNERERLRSLYMRIGIIGACCIFVLAVIGQFINHTPPPVANTATKADTIDLLDTPQIPYFDTDHHDTTYYCIAGSFSNQQNANRFAARYKNSVVMCETPDPCRVSIFTTQVRQKADSFAIRNKVWILKTPQ